MEKYRFYHTVIYDVEKFLNNMWLFDHPIAYSLHTSNDNLTIQEHIHIIVACKHPYTLKSFDLTLNYLGIKNYHFDRCMYIMEFISYMQGNKQNKFKINYLNDFKSIL